MTGEGVTGEAVWLAQPELQPGTLVAHQAGVP